MSLERARTRGQPIALSTAAAWIAEGRVPHAILIVGPASVGKTTLALDLVAGLLCEATDRLERPCRACRACRHVDSGTHPDLHRLAPEGPGGQIRIGRSSGQPEVRGVRDLVEELALLPLEGPVRVAVIEAAHRMNEDAQNALLKTLEEPPPGVFLLLCADEEDHLLPTVRSRCARLRLGPVATRVVEQILLEQGLADPPRAARLSHMSGGRPGLAAALAVAPGAVQARDEITRSLLDLLGARPGRRLPAAVELLARARDFDEAIAAASGPEGIAEAPAGPRPRRSDPASRGRIRPGPAARPGPPAGQAPDGDEPGEAGTGAEGEGARVRPAERRRAAQALLEIWRDLARDLTVAALGGRAELRDLELLEELEAPARSLSARDLARFLARLEEVAGLIDRNANPELAIDVLVLAWPSPVAAA